MSAKNQQQKKEIPENFECAIATLESIVEQMESNQLPLEQLLARYEEGVRLVKFCSDKLAAAEKRIEIISKQAGAKPQVEEFEPEEKPSKTEAQDENVSLF
jgi:exodeoxyribonuclease VII small subunit